MATRSQREAREKRYADVGHRIDKHESGFTPTTFKPPDGMPVFYWKKEGLYTIDIVPYTIMKQGVNPFTDAPKGSLYYERTFYDHMKIGPNQRRYVCLSRTYDKPCPVCERREQMRQNPNTPEDVIKDLYPKERQLMLFFVHEERQKGLQVFESNYKLGFGELLDTKLKASRLRSPTHKNLGFCRAPGGMSIEVLVVEEKWQGGVTKKPKEISFVERETELSDEILDAAPCLDDLLVETAYEKLKNIFLVRSSASDDAEAPAKKQPATHTTNGAPRDSTEGDDDDDDDQDDDVDDEDDADDDEDDAVDPENPEDEEEEDGESATASGDADDADDEPVAPKKKPPVVAKKKKDPVASDFGIKLKSRVKHPDHGVCTVIHIVADGTSMRIEDSEGEVHRMIGPDEVTLVKPKGTPNRDAS